MKNKFITLIVMLALLVPVAAGGGLYLGSIVFSGWLGLQSKPSLTMLYQYWSVYKRLPESIMFPLQVSTAIPALLVLVLVVMILVSVLMPPKRELHGSARFASIREIKKLGLMKKKFTDDEVPDLLLGKFNGDYLRWSSDSTLYLAARSRSGKGVGFVVPNCLHYRHSMVVNDIKKENFFITAGYRAAHNHEVYFFNPSGTLPEHQRNPSAPLVSHRWNPFTYVRRNPVYTFKDILNIASVFYPIPLESKGSEKFFQSSAQKLFTGLAMYLIETEAERDMSLPENKTTLAALFRLATPKDGSSLAEWIKKEIELRDMQPHTKLTENCRTLLQDFAGGNAKTGADILSTLTAPLTIFLDPAVEAATSGDDFYLDDVRKKRMTIYLGVSPEELKIYGTLLNLFFSQLADVNVRQGLPQDNSGKLKYQCLLLLDEFTALGRIRSIEEGISYLAGYGIRPVVVFQAPSQLESVYGKAASQTFFTNFACRIIYSPREQNEAEELSKLIGYYTYKAKSVSKSSGKGRNTSNSTSDQRRAVMNPDELKTMPRTDCVITMEGSNAIYVEKIVYWTDPVFIKRMNWPAPEIPVLNIHIQQKAIGATPKAEYIPPEELAETDWRDTVNAGEIAQSILAALVPPGSPPEYVAALVPVIAQNWGEGSLPMITKLLGEAVVANAV